MDPVLLSLLPYDPLIGRGQRRDVAAYLADVGVTAAGAAAGWRSSDVAAVDTDHVHARALAGVAAAGSVHTAPAWAAAAAVAAVVAVAGSHNLLQQHCC